MENCSLIIILGIIFLLLSKYYKNMNPKIRKYCKYVSYIILSIGIVLALNEIKNGIVQGFIDAKNNNK